MPPDLALLSTLIGSNYPCLELIYMAHKVFEPLKFDRYAVFLFPTVADRNTRLSRKYGCPLQIQSNFNGSNTFGTMKISSR